MEKKNREIRQRKIDKRINKNLKKKKKKEK